MRGMRFAFAAFAPAACVLLGAWPSRADDSHDLHVEVAVVAGDVAPSPHGAGGSLNPLGLGVGARAGVSAMRFYGGLSFMYQVGESQDGYYGPGSHASVSSILYGVEGGFDVVSLS